MKIGVMLDFGRYSNRFDYLDKNFLGVEIGDIVLVSVKGRFFNGLVITKNVFVNESNNPESFRNSEIDLSNNFKYSSIEKIIEKKVFLPWWREWIENMAAFYKVTDLKMFKTAFPPGWIGKSKNSFRESHKYWIDWNNEKNYSEYRLTKKQDLLLRILRSQNGEWQSKLIKSGFNLNQINTLEKNGLIRKSKRPKKCDISLNSDTSMLSEKRIPTLTFQQRKVIDEIEEISYEYPILLWGETGSGKTEVYLRIAQNQLNKNNSCLILAPEIGLIPQLLDRFTDRFKNNVYQYHSNCTSKNRQLLWRKLLDNDEPLIIIGTRSAIFLPIKNLGIIILDEEHDASYKQETPMPCYDAREVALERSKISNTKILFATATPSLNIWKKVYFEKKFKILRMSERISKTNTPEIKVVDMREEYKGGNSKILSKQLLNSLSKLREKNEQAIILVPRRGYSGFLSCRSCGYVVNCPNCETALTVHIGAKGGKWLSCHWCDFKRRFINSCPDCGSNAFKPFGIGTQKVIEFLNYELPQLRLLRFDRDSTSRKDGHKKILNQFSKGNADVIVGTQMIAKGIDIPNVTLSVVLAADGLLHRPDLSAEEKSLQLFLQLAGRSGRADKRGEVIFQTYQPNHPVISYLKKRDYKSFLDQNIQIRKEAKLFPFCKVCLLKISGFNNDLTEERAIKLADYLKPFCKEKKWELVGPAPSLVSKIGKKFRWQILMYGPENTQIPLPSNEKLWDFIPPNVFLLIDMNPIEI
tara:strand:- start:2089 stop:4344 length:2256 start_codon:yes stop_codon:yes gene_type:complete